MCDVRASGQSLELGPVSRPPLSATPLRVTVEQQSRKRCPVLASFALARVILRNRPARSSVIPEAPELMVVTNKDLNGQDLEPVASKLWVLTTVAGVSARGSVCSLEGI